MKGRESGMPEQPYWESFFNPSCILERLGCTGACGDVVEFGCGYGTFTVPAARLVTGHVYACDIDPEMVAVTERSVIAAQVANVTTRICDFITEGCGLADESVGYAMLFNILHIESPERLLREAFRILAPGGSVGIIHWRSDIPTPRGPSMSIRPSARQCRNWGEAVGLDFVREAPLLCCSWHWGIVLRRPFLATHPSSART